MKIKFNKEEMIKIVTEYLAKTFPNLEITGDIEYGGIGEFEVNLIQENKEEKPNEEQS